MAFQIVRNDITKIRADAIVNTANPEPVYSDGTDSAVYNAAGAEKLLAERRKIGRIAEGEVAVTPAFDLQAKYIFHTVGPIWQGGDHGEKETVRKCYQNCLNKAAELEIESIAFPLLATGTYGFPKPDALLIATSVFSSFLADHEMDITLVVFDSESFRLSDKIFAGVDRFIDEKYVEEKIEEEYPQAVMEDRMEMPQFEICDEESEESHHGKRSRKERLRRERRGFFEYGKNAMMAESQAAMCAGAQPLAKSSQRSLDDVVKNVGETWQESLLRLIIEKGYSDTEVYKRANVDRKLFSKIRSNRDYQPKKNTAVAFALALRLNLDETRDFLRRAGYAFSPSSKFDLIIEYSIDHGVYDLMLINGALFDHDQPQLGA